MNNIKIYPWGPLLIKQDIDPNIINIIIKNIPNRGEGIDTDLKTISRRENFNQVEIRHLTSLLDPYFRFYFKTLWEEIDSKVVKYNLNRAWVNIYKKDDYVSSHIHTHCDMSFVLFLKVPPPNLLDLTKHEGNLVFTYGENSDFRARVKNNNMHSIDPKIGEIYIFPNNLNHYSIPISHPQIERISLSGNLIIK